MQLALEDTALADGTPEDDWLAITLDGRELPSIALSQGLRTYEIVRGLATSDETFGTTVALAARLGKTTIAARDIPGFIVNRVARPFYGEALRLLFDQDLVQCPDLDPPPDGHRDGQPEDREQHQACSDGHGLLPGA